MTETVLAGLDGMNPLAYMAALGTLRILTESGGIDARLSWRDEGRWRPVVHTPNDSPYIVDVIMEDLKSWKDAAELGLSYEKDGKTGRAVRDLKPQPSVFRRFLRGAADGSSRRLADFATSYASDFVRDRKGSYVKPTAFHFTAGQQNFLEMVAQLARGLTPEHVGEAVLGPWKYESPLPVLRWDVTGERLYALLAANPAGDKALGVPGADWLAFQGMPLFPCFPEATLGGTARLVTTCFEGRGNDFAFRWPLWEPPASLSAIRSLLASAPHRLDVLARKARGVVLVLESQVRRSDHGYGTFSAPVPAIRK